MAVGATPPSAASHEAGAKSRHVVDRRGGFALTAEQVEQARAHIRDRAIRGQKIRSRAMRVDPRELAILTDYTSWLEGQLEAEEQAHLEARAKFGKELNQRAAAHQSDLAAVLRRVGVARTLLLRRPRWRIWRWMSWWRRIADWLDPSGADSKPEVAAPPAKSLDG